MDIVSNINDAFNGLNTNIQIILDLVTKSPQSNSSIWAVITSIFHIILPMGYSLASLFFLIDFLNKSIMFEYVRWENLIKSLLKLVVAKFFMERSFELLEIIFEVVANIASAISTSPTAMQDIIDIGALQTQVETMNLIDKLFFTVQVFPVTIIMRIIKTAIQVIVYGRMIELYIYTAIAPIPLSTMTSEGLHGVAKRFLQSYTGICLQGVIIMIACLVYTGLTGDMLQVGDGTLDFKFWGLIMSSLVLLLVLVKSGSWAKQITGGM